jgi:hypothetical protein
MNIKIMLFTSIILGLILLGCSIPIPPIPIPTFPPIPFPTTTTTIPGVRPPIKLVHGDFCHVPLQDKSNKSRGKERIRSVGPFRDVRVLEVGDDAFLDSFIDVAFRIENNYAVADDFEHNDVVYVFDHFSVKTVKNKTYDNPLNLISINKGTFRIWWRCHSK